MSRSLSVPRRTATKELQAIVRALVAPDAGASTLATLVSVEGSSYRRPGARLLVSADGTRIGSISGGCLEEDLLARARQVASRGTSEVVVYDTTSENDLVWGVGLGCHGVVRILIEALPPRPSWATTLTEHFVARREAHLAVTYQAPAGIRLETAIVSTSQRSGAGVFVETVAPPTALTIFGAGDDAQPLVRLARELGWLVTVADPRAAFATAARFPTADSIIVGPPPELVERAMLDVDSVAVVMTHHYIHDVPLLRALLPSPVAYLGLLGPKKRAVKILADLAAEGFDPTPAQRIRLHAPVGLDLGADAPEQVALAIVAEIQTTLAGRTARPLRERTQPIHEVFTAAKT
jgi:xanthine dehydrogenase accessory factor